MLNKKLKAAAAFLLMFIMLMQGSVTGFAASGIIYGDIDSDGKITATDSAMVTKYLSGGSLDDSQKKAAAVRDGSSVSSEEAKLILDKARNNDVVLPMSNPSFKPAAGQLTVKDGKLYDSAGNTAQLKGYSTNGAWNLDFANDYTLNKLKNNGVNAVRYDFYSNGYDDSSYNNLTQAIDRTTAKNMYAVVNWHFEWSESVYEPSAFQAEAEEFFGKLSAKYKDSPYVIYEICSTQKTVSWNSIASYANAVIPKIRANNNKALIIVGTPNWNQYVDQAEALNFDNVMYSIQLSAGNHSIDAYKSRIETARSKKLAVFAAQIKTTNDGETSISLTETKKWLDYFDENDISWCAFALEAGTNKSAAFANGTSSSSWTEDNLTESGKFFMNRFKGVYEIETKVTTTEAPVELTTAVIDENYNGVNKNGQLKLVGTNLCNAKGEPIQLRGMSTHGITWFPDFVKEYSVKKTKEYGANLFRVAMYSAENAGYCTGQKEQSYKLLCEGVDNAIKHDMYVIIDWHVLGDLDPLVYKEEAKEFFANVSSRYKNYPNVLYEICNEPNGGTTWNGSIKPYAEEIIPVIRANAPNAVIIVGTENWSQNVDVASNNPLEFDNIMYTIHFYAGSHDFNTFKGKIETALNNGCAIFSTEWGTTDASGNGGINLERAQQYLDYFKEKNISWANWSLSNKGEDSAALYGGTDPYSWDKDKLTTSGRFVFENFTK